METNIHREEKTMPPVSSDEEREGWREMIQRLYNDLGVLFNRERQLVRTELNEKFEQAKRASTSLIIGGVFLFVGLQCLVATTIILVAQFTSAWIAGAMVTAVFFVVGGMIFVTAKKKLNAHDLKPNKSIEAFDHIRFSLKEKVNEITKH